MSVKKFYDYCDGEMREVDSDEVSNCRVWVRHADYEKLEKDLTALVNGLRREMAQMR